MCLESPGVNEQQVEVTMDNYAGGGVTGRERWGKDKKSESEVQMVTDVGSCLRCLQTHLNASSHSLLCEII